MLGMQLHSQMLTTSADQQPSHTKRYALVATHSHAGEHEVHSFSLSVIVLFPCLYSTYLAHQLRPH